MNHADSSLRRLHRRWPLRLAIVGCGAVVESFHLPAAQRCPEVEVSGLADIDLARATQLADCFGIPVAVCDYRELKQVADAFLVATPPHIHRPIVEELLSWGTPVLCEKPLAPTVRDAQAIAEAARGSGTILAVGHNRRFAWNLEAVRTLIQGGGMGKVTSIDVEDGFVFSWPARTGFMFQQAHVGGGALMEHGTHVLDTLLWLFGEPSVEAYEDDALGGLESNVRLRLRFPRGVTARVWITFTCNPRNSIRFEATDGWAEAPIYDTSRLIFHAGRSKICQSVGPVTISRGRSQDYVDLIAAQLSDFARSVFEDRAPCAGAADGLRVIQLIRDAYRMKRDRPLPSAAPLPGATW